MTDSEVVTTGHSEHDSTSSPGPRDVRLCIVAGTRPEAIKVAPVCRAARGAANISVTLVSTGQHSEMTGELFDQLGIPIDVDLKIGRPGQSPNDIAASAISSLSDVLPELGVDALMVQGDTTTAMAAAIAAFNLQIPVVHLEAGLRSGSLAAPFPEEGNRRLIGSIASLHLAPTPVARANLLASSVGRDDIVVTGNTVIDSLAWMLTHGAPTTDDRLRQVLDDPERRVVLATVHRRESWGEPLEQIAAALAAICRNHPEITLVLPLHPNPVVRDPLVDQLDQTPNALLTDPLPYNALCEVLSRSELVISDSGGIQEEAPALGIPVVVLRDTTERVEAVEAGVAHLVGSDQNAIVKKAGELLHPVAPSPASSAPGGRSDGPVTVRPNPFGDGRAGQRAVDAVLWRFGGFGAPPKPFDPPA